MKAYTKGKLNQLLYSSWRTKLEDFFESERQFLTKEFITPQATVLDIGGACGGFGKALQEIEPAIHYTCMDPDNNAIEYGRENFPEFEFKLGFFPDDLPLIKQYDYVIILALFPQLEDWKKHIASMTNVSRGYVNFSCLIRLNGSTVVDKDVSYFYYLDSGERVPQIIHNLYELINFCLIDVHKVKKLKFYGYHTEESGHTNRCLPNREIVKGNMLLELFGEQEEYPGRFGGSKPENFKKHGIVYFEPETEIIIDRKPFEL